MSYRSSCMESDGAAVFFGLLYLFTLGLIVTVIVLSIYHLFTKDDVVETKTPVAVTKHEKKVEPKDRFQKRWGNKES